MTDNLDATTKERTDHEKNSSSDTTNLVHLAAEWRVFYCIAVGKWGQEFFPKSFPPCSFFLRHRQFYRRLPLAVTDHPGGDEHPISQAADRHRFLPSEFALEQHDQIMRQDSQA